MSAKAQPRVALVHDYLTQKGGAERVVLSMLKAFPGAPLYTSLYDPDRTFPEFSRADVRTFSLNRASVLRRHHRLALPLLAPWFGQLRPDADVTVCSSSGWAHGARAEGRKIVYCYAPARWLYQAERYLQNGRAGAVALRFLRPYLVRWDTAAAASADRYLTSSTAMQATIRRIYGIDAELLPPPQTIDPAAGRTPVDGVEPGYFLCVSRLLPYKNVMSLIDAFARLTAERLVVVGAGPDEARLRAAATSNVLVLGRVDDERLRWLYANCRALLSASYEDFGLTPLEAAAFGKPSAALRYGGFLDTVVENETGVLFESPTPSEVRAAVEQIAGGRWDEEALRRHAASYSEAAFVSRLREIVAEVAR